MTEVQPIAGPSSIPLYLINGVATIWDAQSEYPQLYHSMLCYVLVLVISFRHLMIPFCSKPDPLTTAAATLHCQYDISGLRVGTLPGVGQQNGFLGLPMTLMQEETAYLVGKGMSKCFD
jgi:tRNA-splicing endonuclease subunit Sen34